MTTSLFDVKEADFWMKTRNKYPYGSANEQVPRLTALQGKGRKIQNLNKKTKGML